MASSTTNDNNVSEAAASATTNHRAIPNINIINLVAYLGNIFFVNSVPALFHLPDNGEVSQKYQTLVTPAGWAFAIWGLIFLSQAIWAVCQVALPIIRQNPLVVDGVNTQYIYVCVCQVIWTFCFGFEWIGVSTIFMLGILYFLGRIYTNQEKLVATFHSNSTSVSGIGKYWLLRFPFGLHFGWIIAATLVSFNLNLVAWGASTSIQYGMALASIAVAVSVALGVLYQQHQETKSSRHSHPDVVVPLVLVWALNAISKELGNPKESIVENYSTQQIETAQKVAFISASIIVAATVALVLKSVWKAYHATGGDEGQRLLQEEQQQQQ